MNIIDLYYYYRSGAAAAAATIPIFAPNTGTLVNQFGGDEAIVSATGGRYFPGPNGANQHIWQYVDADVLKKWGWRRVKNLCESTNNLTDKTIYKSSLGIITTENVVTVQSIYNFIGISPVAVVAGEVYRLSFDVQNVDGNLNLNAGEEYNSVEGRQSYEIDSTLKRFTFLCTIDTTTPSATFRILEDRASSGWGSAKVENILLERVTGKSNQNPSDCVANGTPVGTDVVEGAGDFTDDSLFTLTDVSITVGGGVLTFDTPSIYKRAIFNSPTTEGVRYYYSFEIYDYVSGTVRVGANEGPAYFIDFNGNGVYTGTVDNVATPSGHFMFQTRTSDCNFKIRNATFYAVTTGLAWKDTTNANTVSSNVVTEAEGEPLHPSAIINSVKTYLTYQDWLVGTTYPAYSEGSSEGIVNYLGWFYTSKEAGNVGNSPATESDKWERIGLYDKFFGHYQEGELINSIQENRNLSDANWNKTNCTATFDQTGHDGVANNASLLNFTANNGTCIYNSITAASDTHGMQMIVERNTGSGTIEATVDGGTTWQDITAELNDRNMPFSIDQDTVTNPQFGFRAAVSGDKIIVKHVGGYLTKTKEEVKFASIINTSGSTQTRGAESCKWDIAGNWNDDFTSVFVFAPLKPSSLVTSAENILAVSEADSNLFNLNASNTLEVNDGTNTATVIKALTEGNFYLITIIGNTSTGKMQIGWADLTAGDTSLTMGSEATYAGMTEADYIHWFRSITAGGIVRGHYIYG